MGGYFLKRTAASSACLVLLLTLTGCATLKKFTGLFFFNKTEPPQYVYRDDNRTIPFKVRPSAKTADSFFQLGLHYLDRREDGNALRAFQKCLEINPDHGKAYNGLGIAFDNLGEYGLAVENYEKALELLPGNHQIINNIGYSHLLQGQLDRAIARFSQAIALSESNPRYRNNLLLAQSKKTALNHLSQGVIVSPPEEPKQQVKGIQEPEKELISAMVEQEPEIAKTPSWNYDTPPLKKRAEVDVVGWMQQAVVAGNLSSYLVAKGYDAEFWQSPKKFHRTTIYYRPDSLQMAYEIAQRLPSFQLMKELSNGQESDCRIKIILGDDLARYFRKRFSRQLVKKGAIDQEAAT